MAETHVAARPGADDDGSVTPAFASDVPADLPPDPEYDVPWRFDVPQFRTLRVVRRVVPLQKVPRLSADDPRRVLYLPRPTAPRVLGERLGLGPWFRLTTRARLATVAFLSAALGLAGSYGSTAELPLPQANPVPAAHVLGAEHWTTAAPKAGTWTAGTTQVGRQDPAVSCAAAALPAELTVFRVSTAPTGVGEQHVTRAATPKSAQALIKSWLAGVRSCEKAAYGKGVQVRTLGTYPGIGEGLTVVGVFYTLKQKGPFGSRRGADLFAVGRDGRLVTTLELDVAGAPGRIPVDAFTRVAKRALAELR